MSLSNVCDMYQVDNNRRRHPMRHKLLVDIFFLKNGRFPASFSVHSKQMLDKSLPMTRFEPEISGVGGDRSTN